ncbi:MAG: ribosome biogenesis GTP-binding protein YsxC [Clostridia bacterium]|nr:ribosome biogenesis GTP-binding protein YsxC [Clostridia bacterium]
MTVNFSNAAISLSAGRAEQFPAPRPCVVFSGRSNVGKSSLINALLGRKSLARTSSTPGKTVTVNFFDVDGKIWFVDLPGYGFAARSYGRKEEFSRVTDDFLSGYGAPKLVLQLIDGKVGPTKDDLTMLDWLVRTGAEFSAVVTKCDKAKKPELARTAGLLSPLCPDIYEVSAVKRQGIDAVIGRIIRFVS